jgi:predicted Fe-S protein YdhL (DUF1289 family)
MDAQSNLCKGCLRTLDEIARWSSMTDEERERIMVSLPQRRQAASDVSEIPVPPLA